MRRKKQSGACTLKFRVDSRGQVHHIVPFSATPGGGAFIRAARESLCHSRYRPARFHGVDVPFEMTAIFNFEQVKSAVEQVDAVDAQVDSALLLPAACGSDGHPHPEPEPTLNWDEQRVNVAKGGPAPLLIGGVIRSMQPLETVLPGFKFGGGPENRVSVTLWEQGISARLEFLPEDEAFRVDSIRYAFSRELTPGMPASLRTEEGLGIGTSCDEVVAAFGTPDGTWRSTDKRGRLWCTLTYRFGDVDAVFRFIDDSLAELRVKSPGVEP